MWDKIAVVASSLVKPIADVATARTRRREAKDAIDGNVKMAKVQGENEAKVAIADWERLSKASEDKTWKDEYVTISLVAPINVIVIDSILTAMGYSDGSATQGTLSALDTLNNVVDVPVGTLISAAVAAALSLKLWNNGR